MGWKPKHRVDVACVVYEDQSSGQIISLPLESHQKIIIFFYLSSFTIDSSLPGIHFDSFQLVDLQIFATPRITLRPLVPTLPCFAKIVVSLMEKVREILYSI
jgi:hypothetical protein